MSISEILDLVNYIVNKEKSGNTLTPEQYNVLIDAVNSDMFKDEYEKAQNIAEAKNVSLGRTLYSLRSLREFRYKQLGVVATVGIITISDLTKTFVYWISMTTTYAGVMRSVEFVSDAEMEDRLTNLLAKPLKYYPVAVINDTEILIRPTNVTPVDFTYLRLPVQPVYNYVIDAYDNTQYLEPAFLTKTVTADVNPTNGHVHQITVAYDGGAAVTICDYTAATADGLTKQVLAQKMAESVNDLSSTTGYFASVGTEEFTIYLNTTTGTAAQYVVAEAGTGAASFTAGTPLEDGTGGSTELEWSEAYHVRFAQELLSRIGVSLKEQQVQAYAEREKQS